MIDEKEDALVDYSMINDVLQIAASIGIFIGLLLVGVQLKQNSNLLKTQLLYEESHRAIQVETAVVGEEGATVWAKSVSDPESLTLADHRIMEALLWSFTEQLRATRLLGELGLIDDTDWRVRVKSESGFMLANRYGTAWWKNYCGHNNPLPSDVTDAVDKRLSELSPEYTLEYMGGVLNSLNEQPGGNEVIPE